MKASSTNYFTVPEACELLDVSRQTLTAYRKRYDLKQTKVKGQVRIDKLDVLQKVYLPDFNIDPKLNFVSAREFRVEECEVVPNIFDVRLIQEIDPFGAVCLLCCLKQRVSQKQYVYVLTGKNSASNYLRDIHFYQEFKRIDSQYIHIDDEILKEMDGEPSGIILPLHLISYKGKEKAVLEDLYKKLRAQGFSEDLCASLGWTLGELADNATTHSGGLCYFMLSSTASDHKYLALSIGDIGMGIPASLQKNATYKDLSDLKAFVLAFKSDVSSWEDFHRRGKGLNDLLSIARGNRACIRAETNGLSIRFDFRGEQPNLEVAEAGTIASGTRYCMVLIDSTFDEVSKNEIDSMLDAFLETI